MERNDIVSPLQEYSFNFIIHNNILYWYVINFICFKKKK